MKSIIITGANSGIGFECAIQIATIAPNEQIILACRNIKSGKEAIEKIKQKTKHNNLLCIPLDLSSLQSIRDFKESYSKQDNKISALINNAGIQNVGKTQFTKDGFESTFGVNHLGPLYLTLLLLPLMENNGSITFTASGVHDPLQKTGIEPPKFKNIIEFAYPKDSTEKQNVVGQRRYSTSKLCNILTVYELQRKLANTGIRINAFDPGMVPGTGLARTYPPLLKFIWKNLMPLLTYFQHNTNTAKLSGNRLANLAYSEQYSEYKGKYFEGAKEIQSSTDSYKQAFQNELWKMSIKLVGIKQNDTSVSLV